MNGLVYLDKSIFTQKVFEFYPLRLIGFFIWVLFYDFLLFLVIEVVLYFFYFELFN